MASPRTRLLSNHSEINIVDDDEPVPDKSVLPSYVYHMILNVVTMAVFVSFYYLTFAHTKSPTSALSWMPVGLTSAVFAALALMGLYSLRHPLFRLSSLAIAVMSSLRTTEFIIRGVHPEAPWISGLLMILGGIEYLLNIYFVARIPSEYIRSKRKEDKKRQPPAEKGKKGEDRNPHEQIANVVTIVLILSSAAMIALGTISLQTNMTCTITTNSTSAGLNCTCTPDEVRSGSNCADNIWIPIAVKWSEAASIVSGIVIVTISISRVQTATQSGFELHSTTHSNGLVLLLLFGGMMVRLALDLVLLIAGMPIAKFLPNVSLDPFQDGAKEILTLGIPLGMHFFNIHAKSCSVEKRTWVAFLLVALTFNLLVAGYVVNSTDPSKGFSIMLARVGALLSAVYLNLAILSILNPISQLLYSRLNIGVFTRTSHKMHFHRNVALNAVIFFLIHAGAHIYTWARNPHYEVSGHRLYSIWNPSILTGFGMLACFLLALASGLSKFRDSLFWTHILFVVIGVVLFMVHGYQQLLGPPIGDYMTMFVVIFSYLAVEIFKAINPIHRLQISHDDCREYRLNEKNYYFLLALKNHNLTALPGPFFNIYNTDTPWKLFHAHSFSSFSTDLGFTCFLIFAKGSSRSFTHKLRTDVTTRTLQALYLHGPFLSPGNSLIDYVTTHRHSNLVVFLCGTNTGMAPVSSLASFFRSRASYFQQLVVKVICQFDTHGMDQSFEGKPPFLPKFNELAGLHLEPTHGPRRKDVRKIAKLTQQDQFQANRTHIEFYHIVNYEETPDEIQTDPIFSPTISSVGVANQMSRTLLLSHPDTFHLLFFCGSTEPVISPTFSKVFTEVFN